VINQGCEILLDKRVSNETHQAALPPLALASRAR
jgi:hypothetical protein